MPRMSCKSRQFQAPHFVNRNSRRLAAFQPRSATAIAHIHHRSTGLLRSRPGAHRTVRCPMRAAHPHCQCTICKACPSGRLGRAVLHRRKTVPHRVDCRTGHSRQDPRRSPAWKPHPSSFQHRQRPWTAYIARQTFMYASWRLRSLTAPLKLPQFKFITWS